jgi:AraC-like DNA-binding protein
VITLGQLALIAGYYDQAHFSKDFKRFSGSTPQEFFAAQHEFIQITTPSEVVEFLQD